MRIDILTLFPEMFTPLSESILKRAQSAGYIDIRTHNIRDYSEDKHKKCDDYPFGGGAGMLMTPQPIASAIAAVDPKHEAHRIYLSPKGKVFSQSMVKAYAEKPRLLFLCGHYEGVDQRVIDLFIDEELSIGDYVLTGGELPAMVITDAVCRYVEGVLNQDSLTAESHTNRRLEYPQYTRPQEFMGLSVPEILLSGDHAKVDEWRARQSLLLTRALRPDLLTEEEMVDPPPVQKPKKRRSKKAQAPLAAENVTNGTGENSAPSQGEVDSSSQGENSASSQGEHDSSSQGENSTCAVEKTQDTPQK